MDLANPPHLLGKARGKDPKTKSYFWPRGARLEGHIGACVGMCLFLFDEVRFGRLLYKISGLKDQKVPYKKFRNLCLVALLCHDFGKANSEFQRMLWEIEAYIQAHRKDIPDDERYNQRLRHEFLSLYILANPNYPYWNWLCQATGSAENAWLVTCAAFGHHRKTDREPNLAGQEPIYIYREKLAEILNPLTMSLGIPPIPVLPDDSIGVKDGTNPQIQIFQAIQKIEASHISEQEALDKKPLTMQLALLLKLVTVLCDVLGSMTPRHETQLPEFEDKIKIWLRGLYTPGHIAFRGRISAQALVNPNDLQKAAMKVVGNGDVLVIAGTGGGKTTAGFYIAANRKDEEGFSIPLITTLPTTAATTDMFHKNKLGDHDALRHSMQALDEDLLTAHIASNGDPADDEENPADTDLDAIIKTLTRFSEVTYATVDQVLGILTYNRKAILWLLHIVQSQIVFDEFHSYDEKLQAYYLLFIRIFPGIPKIHLSATVPPSLVEEVSKASAQKGLNTKQPLQIIRAPQDTSDRFHIHIVSSMVEALKHFRPGGLCICNTIGSAQEVGHRFPKARVLHSRFLRVYRRRNERETMEEFKNNPQGVMVVATQVAEMSLDISAQMAIIEVCPEWAFIQRLGRILRMYHERVVDIAHIYVVMPESKFPYAFGGNSHKTAAECPEYQKYLAFIQSLAGRPISQKDLADAYESLPEKPKYKGLPAYDIFHTLRKSLRHTRPTFLAFREEDTLKTPEILLRRKGWKQAMKVEIPISGSPGRLKKLPFKNGHYILDQSWEYDDRLGLLLPGQQLEDDDDGDE